MNPCAKCNGTGRDCMRCDLTKERDARRLAEKKLAENHINHASCHECPCKLNFDNYKLRAVSAEKSLEIAMQELKNLSWRAHGIALGRIEKQKALRDGGKEK